MSRSGAVAVANRDIVASAREPESERLEPPPEAT